MGYHAVAAAQGQGSTAAVRRAAADCEDKEENMKTNDERCVTLLRKHGLNEHDQAIIAAVREAYLAGRDLHVMLLRKDESVKETPKHEANS